MGFLRNFIRNYYDINRIEEENERMKMKIVFDEDTILTLCKQRNDLLDILKKDDLASEKLDILIQKATERYQKDIENINKRFSKG